MRLFSVIRSTICHTCVGLMPKLKKGATCRA